MSTLTSRRQLAVGDRAVSGPARPLADVLADAGVTLPTGSPLLGPAAAELLTPAIDAATRVGLQWSSPAALGPDAAVRAESLITRVQQSGSGAAVHRHIRLLDEADAVRAEGTETWRLADASAARADAATDFCSPRWGELLSGCLTEDPDFESSLSTWDGTIGLRCVDGGPADARELHLRIYRGQIIDVTRRVPHGATFTFVAPAHTWVELMLGERNDFMRRAISGEFSSTGDGYEYLRLTKPLNLIIAHGRAIAKEAS